MKIKIGYLLSDWKDGIKTPLYWDTDTAPHMAISGITGGAKTVSAQLIVNQLLDAKVDISICDFKAGGDWDNIVPKDRYAEYTFCDDLLTSYYQSFLETILNKGHEEKYIIFDEFSSYSLSKDSKAFKELMSMCSHLAFMGRSFGYHLIFISQQFNSKVLDTASPLRMTGQSLHRSKSKRRQTQGRLLSWFLRMWKSLSGLKISGKSKRADGPVKLL